MSAIAQLKPMPRRAIFDDEHEDYRESFRSFLDAEVVPDFARWDEDGLVPRELFTKAAEHGFMGMAIPEQYGGPGVDDWRFNVRMSNTEPVVRLNVESRGDAALMEAKRDELLAIVHAFA